jgi:hypothetical protein
MQFDQKSLWPADRTHWHWQITVVSGSCSLYNTPNVFVLMLAILFKFVYNKSLFSKISSYFTNPFINVHYWKLSLWEKWYVHKRIFWFTNIKTMNEQSEVHITWPERNENVQTYCFKKTVILVGIVLELELFYNCSPGCV